MRRGVSGTAHERAEEGEEGAEGGRQAVAAGAKEEGEGSRDPSAASTSRDPPIAAQEPSPAQPGQGSAKRGRTIGPWSTAVVYFVGLVILALGTTYAVNYFSLQTEMEDVLSRPRNEGVEVNVHYGAYVDGSTLVYDLRSVPADKSMVDVFRVFLQFADSVQTKEFATVELCFCGDERFRIDGTYFQKLGREYSTQNPIYTIRTFPEHLRRPAGRRAFPKRRGGWLYVLARQTEDFAEFHRQWYLADLARDAEMRDYDGDSWDP